MDGLFFYPITYPESTYYNHFYVASIILIDGIETAKLQNDCNESAASEKDFATPLGVEGDTQRQHVRPAPAPGRRNFVEKSSEPR